MEEILEDMKLLMLLVAEMDMVSWVVVEEDKVEDKELLLMVLIECLLEDMEGMEVEEDNGSWKVLVLEV